MPPQFDLIPFPIDPTIQIPSVFPSQIERIAVSCHVSLLLCIQGDPTDLPLSWSVCGLASESPSAITVPRARCFWTRGGLPLSYYTFCLQIRRAGDRWLTWRGRRDLGQFPLQEGPNVPAGGKPLCAKRLQFGPQMIGQLNQEGFWHRRTPLGVN